MFHYMDKSQFVYLFTYWWIFWAGWAIVNTVVKIKVLKRQGFEQTYVFTSLWVQWLAAYWVNIQRSKHCQMFFKVVVPFYIPISCINLEWLLYITPNTWYSLLSVISYCGFNLYFLPISNYVIHLFTYLFLICVATLWNVFCICPCLIFFLSPSELHEFITYSKYKSFVYMFLQNFLSAFGLSLKFCSSVFWRAKTSTLF